MLHYNITDSFMALRFIDLSVGFKERTIFSGLNATIENGESLALMGCNGSGKSTFLKTIALRTKPLAGKILFNDRPLKISDIGYLPQYCDVITNIGLSAGEFIDLGVSKKISKSENIAAFKEFGIENSIDEPLCNLSGGQLNRLRMVRIELQNPSIILFDEPLASLDVDSRNLLLNRIDNWKSKGKIVIISIHDINLAINFNHFLTLDGENALWEQRMKAHKHDCVLA